MARAGWGARVRGEKKESGGGSESDGRIGARRGGGPAPGLGGSGDCGEDKTAFYTRRWRASAVLVVSPWTFSLARSLPNFGCNNLVYLVYIKQ